MYKQDFYQDATNLSISQENLIQYDYTKNFIHISSVDRDISQFPQPQEYRIRLDQEYKNVVSVRLINAVIPKSNNSDLEPYLILQIDELPNVCMAQSRDTMKDAFLVMYLNIGVGNFLNINSDNCHSLVKTYKTPLAKLDRLTIHILNYLGTPFNFGTDNGALPLVKSIQNSFLFEIITVEKKRTSLQTRAVF